jgi:nickel-dependent lactate racemase
MRLDLKEAGRIVGGPTLIVNTVLDPSLNPVSVVCGDAVAAHRVGVRLSRELYGIEVPQRADVVVTSAYPMDRDLRQAGKCILNVSAACRPGGVIVASCVARRGWGTWPYPDYRCRSRSHGSSLGSLEAGGSAPSHASSPPRSRRTGS